MSDAVKRLVDSMLRAIKEGNGDMPIGAYIDELRAVEGRQWVEAVSSEEREDLLAILARMRVQSPGGRFALTKSMIDRLTRAIGAPVSQPGAVPVACCECGYQLGSEPKCGTCIAGRAPSAQAGGGQREPVNQCDGCRRGMPVVDGIHRNKWSASTWATDAIACTADRYKAQPPATGGDADLLKQWRDMSDLVRSRHASVQKLLNDGEAAAVIGLGDALARSLAESEERSNAAHSALADIASWLPGYDIEAPDPWPAAEIAKRCGDAFELLQRCGISVERLSRAARQDSRDGG